MRRLEVTKKHGGIEGRTMTGGVVTRKGRICSVEEQSDEGLMLLLQAEVRDYLETIDALVSWWKQERAAVEWVRRHPVPCQYDDAQGVWWEFTTGGSSAHSHAKFDRLTRARLGRIVRTAEIELQGNKREKPIARAVEYDSITSLIALCEWCIADTAQYVGDVQSITIRSGEIEVNVKSSDIESACRMFYQGVAG